MVLLSDRGNWYQNFELLITISFVVKVNGLRLLKFIDTERQDEKSMVDVSLTIATNQASSFVSQEHGVTASSGLVMALRDSGGLKHFVAKLVVINQNHSYLNCLTKLCESGGKLLD